HRRCLMFGQSVAIRVLVLGLLLVAASPSSGRASVKYLSSGTPPSGIPRVLVVFPKFSTPTRGHCNELAGYEGSSAFAFPASATACLNAAGNMIYIGVTVRTFSHAQGGPAATTYQQLLSFELPYPASTGGFVAYEHSGDLHFAAVSDASLVTCHPFPMP